MAEAKPKSSAAFGVHSEVGQLRKVMVCAPGRAHQRLTPSNCDQLLFDDVMWVENAKRDHFDFVQKMRDRGVDVVEMHNLLTETVALPDWMICTSLVGTTLLRNSAINRIRKTKATTAMAAMINSLEGIGIPWVLISNE